MKNPQIEEKIRALLAQMTLEEKVGQLQQCGPSLVGAFEVSFEELLNMMFDGRISQEEFGKLMSTATQDYHEEDLRAGRIGSYNGIGDAATANRLQKIAVEESRLGIPLIFGYDVIHGFTTISPIPLAESCAFDPDLWERTGRMAAQEATAAGIHMTFAPMVDIAKDARWGRVSEGAGEDVLMNGLYGAAKVRGFQGKDLAVKDAMAACVKHFAAYGACEAGRDYNRVDMSKQRLYEEYLPSYKACVDAGARAIMPAFNDINGVPCSVNDQLLMKILREDWDFDGMTVSDANAIAECVNHGIAEDRKEAAAMALKAGMDMDMTSNCYIENVAALVEEGKVSMEELDRAVSDILRIKFEMNLFEQPYRTDEAHEQKTISKPEFRTLAREAAVKSMVLLKNDENLLPLSKNLKVGVIGELAADQGEMTGAWAIGAKPELCVSLNMGLDHAGISYQNMAKPEENAEFSEKKQLKDFCEDCDVILAVLGEHKDQSGEASSRADITLPADQIKLVKKLKKIGKPVVVILFNGRPLAIPEVADMADAILEAWHPGVEAGNAIADILFGDAAPSGKLTTTFPYTSGQCPMYYAHINTGRPGGRAKFTSKYLDTPVEPVYPFGFGLTYTTCLYENVAAAFEGERLKASVEVVNTGDRACDEIVQCYVQDVTASGRVRPVLQLKAFEKTSLQPGERKKVSFEIPVSELGYYDREMNYVVEPGLFKVMIGANSRDTLCCEARLTN